LWNYKYGGSDTFHVSHNSDFLGDNDDDDDDDEDEEEKEEKGKKGE